MRVSFSVDKDSLVVAFGDGVGDHTKIPLASIEGFCVQPLPPSPLIPWDAELVVVWRDGQFRRHKTFPLVKEEERTRRLLSALVSVRPDASLLHLPTELAMRRLGVISSRRWGMWVGIPTVVVLICVLAGIFITEDRANSCGKLRVSCAAAVSRYLDDPAEAPRAARELEVACAAGNLQACAALGPFLIDGAGVHHDEQRAFDAIERACSGRVASGCNNLGVLFAKGVGVALSEPKATESYKRACELGDVASGCYNYGSMLVGGFGVAKDETRGATYLSRSCEVGESNGCLTLGTLYAEGRGVKADARRADELYRRACKAGNTKACDAVQGMGHQVARERPFQ